MKHSITITVDLETYRKHRAAHHNISKLCSDYLEHYFDDQTNFKIEKKQEAEKAIKAFEAVKRTEAREKELKALLIKAREYRALHPERTQSMLRDICADFGLNLAEAVRRMEQI